MIDFNVPHWFDQYLDYRRAHPLQFDDGSDLAEDLNDKVQQRFTCLHDPFYIALQRSGVIYGFPVHYPFQSPNGVLKKLSGRERAKLILLDLLMHARLLRADLPTGEAYQDAIDETANLIIAYYRGLHQFGHQEEPELLERILFQRVRFKRNSFDFRKTGISSLLFWDLYFFEKFCTDCGRADFDREAYFTELIRQKKLVKKITLRLIAATAHADRDISRQEKTLHRQFERSSKMLLPEEIQTLREAFEAGVDLAAIDLPPLDWLARRFLLDICLLVVHVDAKVDALEAAFLAPLVAKLQLTNDDLLSSKADLGCFLLLYGKELHIFKGEKTGVALLGQAMMENFVKLGYAAKLEAVETKDMAITFGRVLAAKLHLNKNGELPDDQEIKEAISQLKDIPKFLPFFSMMFLPVPGITEAYIFLAFGLEKLSGGSISLLPTQIGKVVRGERKKKEK
jgi:hypothetical protein